MTQVETLSLWFSGVQTVAIVISLFALWRQLRQFNENMRYDAYSKYVEDASRVSELLLTHPKLNAIYFSQQSEVSKLDDEQKDFYNFLALVLGFCERLYNLTFNKKWGDEATWKTWDTWLTVQWFPIALFEVYWRNEKLWYTVDFRNWIDRRYEQYQAEKRLLSQLPKNVP